MAFYITTPLYYVNDKPHIGTAYSTIMADILHRYHKLFGEDSLFLTGTDEHGQKVQQAADLRGMPPQAHCDSMVKNFQETWKELTIDYDIFFRTTDDFHKKAVQQALQQLFDNGDIYEHTYEGWYSVSEEIFYTEKDLIDGKSPTGKDVIQISEKNYFFKMSKYIDELKAHILQNPKFIQPEVRKNEVLGFLAKDVNDLCISRPKSRLKWGIPIPFDQDYVTYVWFDALLNYATGLGYLQPHREKEFQKWWPEAHHSIGKDILTTHAVYWTTMLLALGQPLPKTIFAHGWVLNQDDAKMSKSAGEVIDPMSFKDLVGVDGLRYYFASQIPYGNDGKISKDLVFQVLNSELANKLGNLLSRSTNLIDKYFQGKAPRGWLEDKETKHLMEVAQQTTSTVRTSINSMAPQEACSAIVNLLNEANRYLEIKAPWKVAKNDLLEAGHVLYASLECLRITGILLQPVMPTKCKILLDYLSVSDRTAAAAEEWGLIAQDQPILKGEPLFPRI